MLRMETDTERIVDIHGHQFDHGGPDASLCESGVCFALDWIADVCAGDISTVAPQNRAYQQNTRLRLTHRHAGDGLELTKTAEQKWRKLKLHERLA